MAAPTIASMTPNTAWFDDPAGPMIFIGAGFLNTSQILWGGMAMPGFEFISDTEVRAAFDPATATYDEGTMTAEVWVANGFEWSNIMTFTFAEHTEPEPEPEPASPNTPAIPAVYMSPEPPDVYRVVATP